VQKSFNGLSEQHRRRNEFQSNEEAIRHGCRSDVSNSGLRDSRLAVEHQADGLHGFHSEHLTRFDEGAMRSEIPDSYRPAGVEGPPEGTEYFKPDIRSSIRRCPHHHSGC
jgi:hypothetical protein